MLCKKKSRLQAACRTGRPALKSAAGFTLVELIVVIAILAILAAVAVPAYTGYIKKANQASDDAQIVVINEAIAAAAAINGYDMSDITAVTVSTGDGTLSTIAISNATDDDKTKVIAAYEEFYEGNTLELKHYDSLKWNEESHLVEGEVSGSGSGSEGTT